MNGSSARTTVADASRPGISLRRAFLQTRHGVLNVLSMIADHTLLLVWFVFAADFVGWFVYLPASLLACLIHQRAMSEWIHEGAHFNLTPHRRWNDRLTNLLAGVWFLMPVTRFRATHFAHHAKAAFFVADDPDTEFLELDTKRAFPRAVWRDLCGITILGQFRRFGAKASADAPGWRGTAPAEQGSLLGTALALGRLDVPLLYYGTLGTLYPLLNRLRVYAQHVTLEPWGRSPSRGSPTSRTIHAGWWGPGPAHVDPGFSTPASTMPTRMCSGARCAGWAPGATSTATRAPGGRCFGRSTRASRLNRLATEAPAGRIGSANVGGEARWTRVRNRAVGVALFVASLAWFSLAARRTLDWVDEGQIVYPMAYGDRRGAVSGLRACVLALAVRPECAAAAAVRRRPRGPAGRSRGAEGGDRAGGVRAGSERGAAVDRAHRVAAASRRVGVAVLGLQHAVREPLHADARAARGARPAPVVLARPAARRRRRDC